MTARRRLLFSAAAAALLVILVVLFQFAGRHRAPIGPWLLEVELQASAGFHAQLFWTRGLHFVEEQSSRLRLTGGGAPQTLRFQIPRGAQSLRFDPTDAKAEVLIRRMALKEADGRVIASFGAESLTSPHQISSVTRRNGGTSLVTSGDDPWVILSTGCLSSEPTGNAGASFSGVSLAVSSVATIGLIAACVMFIVLDLVRTNGPDQRLLQRRSTLLWIPAVFLLVLAAKLLVMRHYPVTVPFWDQWDGEARALYMPYYSCGLSWSHMFQLHNEHRIFFSRLLALALVVINGQWDPRVQQVVNAGLHSFTALLLLLMLWRGFEWRRLELVAALVLPIFILPFAWENILLGFQSAFYLFLMFSLLGLWLTTVYAAGSAGWWTGCLAVLCGLFTAAGGVLMPAVMVGVAVLKLTSPPRAWKGLALTLLAAGAILALGVATMSPPIPHHETFKAATIRVFLAAFFRNLAWPWVEHPVAGIVLWLPFAGFCVAVALRRGRATVFERFVAGLAVWVIGQAAAIAYGRGGGWLVPATRYQDFLSLGLVVNTVVLIWAVTRTGPRSLARRGSITALAVWIIGVCVGLDGQTSSTLRTLDGWRPYWRAHEVNVRRFVVTGDVQEFNAKAGQGLPYPSSESLAEVLQQPIIRRILPAAIRAPLTIEPRLSSDSAFVPYGAYPTTPNDPALRGWGSYTPRGNGSTGYFESRPVEACEAGTHLSIPVAGYLGLENLSLSVRDDATGQSFYAAPAAPPHEAWIPVTVPCPSGQFTLVAADHRPDYWLAFREPVEIGSASIAAERVIEAAMRLVLIAVALLIAAVRVTA